MRLRFNQCVCCRSKRLVTKSNKQFTAPVTSDDFFYGGWKYIKNLVKCKSCGYQFIGSLPDGYLEFYLDFGADNQGYTDGKIQRLKYFLALKNKIQKITGVDFTQLTSILDIGAGDGIFLDSLGPGLEKTAVESSIKLRPLLESKNITVYSSIDILPENKCYELLSMHDFLEHVEDPFRYIGKVLPLVRDGGYILISVPDYSRIFARILQHRYYLTTPMHFSYFTWRAMRKLLGQYPELSVLSVSKAPAVYASLADVLKWLSASSLSTVDSIFHKIPIGYRSNFMALLRKA